jgi:hypothetical protein
MFIRLSLRRIFKVDVFQDENSYILVDVSEELVVSIFVFQMNPEIVSIIMVSAKYMVSYP